MREQKAASTAERGQAGNKRREWMHRSLQRKISRWAENGGCVKRQTVVGMVEGSIGWEWDELVAWRTKRCTLTYTLWSNKEGSGHWHGLMENCGQALQGKPRA